MRNDTEIRLPSSKNILQINELSETLRKENIDWGIFCKLLTEMFTELKAQVISLYCVEISKFAMCCINADFDGFLEFPSDIYYLIDDALSLYLYPARFAPTSPEKLLKKASEISSRYKISIPYKTKREIILEMYENETDIQVIAEELEIRKELVEKTLILAGFKIKGLNGEPALQWHSLWSKDDC